MLYISFLLLFITFIKLTIDFKSNQNQIKFAKKKQI